MIVETLPHIVTFGAAGIAFLATLAFGAVELLGKIYGSYRCLDRGDLTSEQRLIYLGLIWIVPFGWLIYFLLGTERTQQLFSDTEFL